MTGENATTGAGVQENDPLDTPESKLSRLMSRMQHVYRTRVRTTTVVLVIVWLALLAFYGFSSQHYEPTRNSPGQVTQTPQVQPTRTTVPQTTTPTTTSAPESSTTDGQGSASTSVDESVAPTSGPATGQRHQAPETTTVAPQQSTQVPESVGG